jgi:hypothetical protein
MKAEGLKTLWKKGPDSSERQKGAFMSSVFMWWFFGIVAA